MDHFGSSWLNSKAKDLWRQSEPDEVIDDIDSVYPPDLERGSVLDHLVAWTMLGGGKAAMVNDLTLSFGVGVYVRNLKQDARNVDQALDELALCGEKWRPVASLIRFDANPSCKHLLQIVRDVREFGLTEVLDRISSTWMSEWIVSRLQRGDDPTSLEESIVSGALGEINDWQAIEDAFVHQGFSIGKCREHSDGALGLPQAKDLTFWMSRVQAAGIGPGQFQEIVAAFEIAEGDKAFAYAEILSIAVDTLRHVGFSSSMSQETFLKFARHQNELRGGWHRLSGPLLPDQLSAEFWRSLADAIKVYPKEPYLTLRMDWKDTFWEYITIYKDFRLLRLVKLSGFDLASALPFKVSTRLSVEDAEYRWLAFRIDIPHTLEEKSSQEIAEQIVGMCPLVDWSVEDLLHEIADDRRAYPPALQLLTSLADRQSDLKGVSRQDVHSACMDALARSNYRPAFR